jgi:hypothetical protein
MSCPTTGPREQFRRVVRVTQRQRLQLQHLPRPQRAEAFWRNSGDLQGVGKRNERLIDRFVGQLERAVMVGERSLGAAINQCLHRLCRIHVIVVHEPTWLVGPDRQNGEPERSVSLARAAEISAVAIAGVSDEIDASTRRFDHERRP